MTQPVETMTDPAPTLAAGECRAVLDVGSNSVKLLVGRVSGSRVEPLLERSVQTRLGARSFTHRRLLPDAIARTTAAIRDLLREAAPLQPRRLRAVATAAAREASNREDLRDALRAEGIHLDILDGIQEADMAFRGVNTDPRLTGRTLMVTDLGGGSTEFILGSTGHRHFNRSFPLGAVRLFETLHPAEPPTPACLERCRTAIGEFLTRDVLPGIRDALRQEAGPTPLYVAVGGTAVILARLVRGLAGFDRKAIEDSEISADELRGWTERLWSLPIAQRRQLPGLPPERADIMLTGAAVHEGILRTFGLPSLRPSTRGLRYAALLDDTD